MNVTVLFSPASALSNSAVPAMLTKPLSLSVTLLISSTFACALAVPSYFLSDAEIVKLSISIGEISTVVCRLFVLSVYFSLSLSVIPLT
ncbi:MAG: hypothetical protein L6V93_15140 [Clostridiales bacterium]|nr:MAG: hypothetical protein L6V93_15140 [Clostridiales bacterium]